MPRCNRVNFDPVRLRDALQACGSPRERTAARAGISIASLHRALAGKPVSRPVAISIARSVGRGIRALLAPASEAASAASRSARREREGLCVVGT
jgi:hypothetical protein